ncbi:cupredoxin domain-containing protein [Sphaerisporangium aureirubrum]|uniref:Cupredoxin domain-containing protein n=1 Tax=Sphaerisporangium aureirubrum TaxID=1544736 RepID=A0ABW1NVY9_9ACTN
MGGGGVQVVTVWVTEGGYRPGVVVVGAGRGVEVVFRAVGDPGCGRSVVVLGREVVVPVGGERVVRLPAQPVGRVRFVCGMGMYVGFIDIKDRGSS